MKKFSRGKKWTKKEVGLLENYAISQAEHLVFKFYENIISGSMEYRKNKGFFRELSKIIGKSSAQCKSKFQKIEEQIYLDLLHIPEDHYDLYLYIRNENKLYGCLHLKTLKKNQNKLENKADYSIFQSEFANNVLLLEKKKKKQFNMVLHMKYENLRAEILNDFKEDNLNNYMIGKIFF